MILSDTEILREIKRGNIVISDFDIKNLGSNSYDLHLYETLAVYTNTFLDAKKINNVEYIYIPKEGYILKPGILYLGVTKEYTETHKHVPFIEGKSSIGRLGINIHATAGKGDVGFCNTWTLEISVIQPIRIYAFMPIAQIIYFKVKGKVKTKYCDKKSAKYNTLSHLPEPSKMYLNFDF